MPSLRDDPSDLNPYAPPQATDAADVAPPPDEDDDALRIPAERGTRWWARFVDNLLLGAACLPAVALSAMAEGKAVDALSAASAIALIVPLGLLVYQWYLLSTRGQSIAKRWMHIQIVRLDGSPVSFVTAVLLRSWIVTGMQFIPFVGYFVGLLDAAFIFGAERRCLHDHIAGTKVVLVLPGH